VTSVKMLLCELCLKIYELIRAKIWAIEHVQHADTLNYDGAPQQSAPQVFVPEINGEANAIVYEIDVQTDSSDGQSCRKTRCEC
jgi:hypothetical protein